MNVLSVGYSRFALGLVAAVLVSGCQPTRSPDVQEPGPESAFPEAPAVENSQQFLIDSDDSEIDILVYRAGSLASLGHNHVVSVRSLKGEVQLAEEIESSAFALSFSVNELIVDDPETRQRYGKEFSSTVDADAVAGTRTNMLSSDQLNGQVWPEIKIHSTSLTQLTESDWQVSLDVMVRGKRTQLVVPVVFLQLPDQLTINADFAVSQTDLGLTPFSVMLGALKVRDQLDIRIRLSAIRAK